MKLTGAQTGDRCEIGGCGSNARCVRGVCECIDNHSPDGEGGCAPINGAGNNDSPPQIAESTDAQPTTADNYVEPPAVNGYYPTGTAMAAPYMPPFSSYMPTASEWRSRQRT